MSLSKNQKRASEVIGQPHPSEMIQGFVIWATAQERKIYVSTKGGNFPLLWARKSPAGTTAVTYRSTMGEHEEAIIVSIDDVKPGYLLGRDNESLDVLIFAEPVLKSRMNGIGPDMATFDDAGYIGRQFGDLKVLQTMGWQNRARYALCRCACGGMKIARIASMLRRWVISCGCRRGKNTELPLNPGAKYGHLTVIKQVPRPDDQEKLEGYYLVRCVCGNEHIRGRENVVTPKNPDCGCHGLSLLIGQRFGRLVITGEGKLEDQQRLVATHCDCGTQGYARLSDLRIGKKKSCGCLKKVGKPHPGKLALSKSGSE